MRADAGTRCSAGNLELLMAIAPTIVAVSRRPRTAPLFPQLQPDLIILAITSQARPQIGLGEAVIARWKEAGLLRPSVLEPVVATIERPWSCESLDCRGEGIEADWTP